MGVRGLVAAAITFLLATNVTAQLGSGTTGTIASYPAFTKAGWWFRVNTADTKAAKITFRLNSVEQNTTASDWWFHSGGRRPELSFAIRSGPDITLQLTAEPADAKGSVCAFFKETGVQLIEFSGQVRHPLSTTQQDQRCRAASD